MPPKSWALLRRNRRRACLAARGDGRRAHAFEISDRGRAGAGLPGRYEREAQHLANLTGWPIAEIREQMMQNGQSPPAPGPEDDPWWRRLWPKG